MPRFLLPFFLGLALLAPALRAAEPPADTPLVKALLAPTAKEQAAAPIVAGDAGLHEPDAESWRTTAR
jgi:hypothetical protein